MVLFLDRNGPERGAGTEREVDPSELPLNSDKEGRLGEERLLYLTDGGGVTDL